MMQVQGLKLRWIYGACYEIVLPNGKVIVTDPFITPDKLEGFNVDDITGADYVLCTHTHYDHTADIGYLLNKFKKKQENLKQVVSSGAASQPKLIAGEMSLPALCEYFNLDYFFGYPIVSGETYEFEDFRLQAFRAKHVGHPAGNSTPEKAPKTSLVHYGVSGHGECDKLGWLEEYDYVITTKNNLTIMIVAGVPAYSNIYKVADQIKPNVVIRQFFGQPKDYAKVLQPFSAQLYFPNHHEHLEKFFGISAKDYMDKAREELRKISPYCDLINPTPYQWYSVSLSAQEVH